VFTTNIAPRFRSARLRTIGAVAAVLVAAGALQLFDANPAASQTLRLTAYSASDDPGLDPAHKAWKNAVAVQVPLSSQAGAYVSGGGSIPMVTAKALHVDNRLLIRVEWADATRDESTTRVQDFADAVALEFPARAATSVPAICMGQADAGVNIWHWRADSQAGFKEPAQVYAGSIVDMYPSRDTLFFTARAAGNPYSNPEAGPVQTLVSQTFGTLTAATVQDVQGSGVYKDGTWAVVFERAYTGADGNQASFSDGARTDMAFAVWNGSEGDRNGKKSVSQFVQLSIMGGDAPGSDGANRMTVLIAVALLVGLSGLGVTLATVGTRGGKVR
jgi:DMSO reductase family type II enzyme heme b subunit